jgi:hypothetical protein
MAYQYLIEGESYKRSKVPLELIPIILEYIGTDEQVKKPIQMIKHPKQYDYTDSQLLIDEIKQPNGTVHDEIVFIEKSRKIIHVTKNLDSYKNIYIIFFVYAFVMCCIVPLSLLTYHVLTNSNVQIPSIIFYITYHFTFILYVMWLCRSGQCWHKRAIRCYATFVIQWLGMEVASLLFLLKIIHN